MRSGQVEFVPTAGASSPARGRGRVLGAVGAVVAGAAAVVSPPAAAAVGALAVVATLALAAPGLLVASVLPASFLTYRIGPASLADLVLVVVVGVVIARGVVTPLGTRLRAAILVASGYLGLLVLVVAAAPSTTAALELAHRGALVIGAMIAGAAAAQLGVVELSVKLLVLTGAVYATAALVQAVVIGFGPAYPLGVTKNHAGGIMAMAVLILIAEPSLGRGVWIRFFTPLLILGLLATQSRAGIIALLVGLGYVFLRAPERRRQLLVPAAAGGALAAATAWSLNQETEIAPEVGLSSVTERLSYWEQAFHDWQSEPLFGRGLRYYLEADNGFPVPFTDEFPDGAPAHPHDLVLEALAESGVVGTLGLLLLAVGTLVIVGRCKGRFALVAEAAVVATLVVGLFDLFWLAGRTVIPFFMVGVVTALASQRERRR